MARSVLSLAALAAVAAAPAAHAQVASALLTEGGPIPGAPAGQTVDFLNNTAVNHVGGYAIGLTADDAGSSISTIWGNASGGPGDVLRVEGTFGNLQQVSFESFYGISDSGQLAYSPSTTDLMTGTTGLDGVWLDDVVVAIEEQPVPSLPGQFWSFGSRPGVTAGGTPYWVGGVTSSAGGSTQNRGLFFDSTAQVVLLGGQVVPNLPLPLDDANTVSFDYRFSANGSNHIAEVQLEGASSSNDNAMVLNGAGLLVGGALVREGDPVPPAAGGLGGEAWDNFDFTGVSEAGSWFFTGDTSGASATDEIVVVDGAVVLREGDLVDGQTLSGSIEGGFRNEDGDLGLVWDVSTGEEVLIVNGSIVLMEGDLVDFDGDGMPDPGAVLADFTGISTLTVGDRNAQGQVDVYFTADVDFNGTSSSSDDLEGFFRLTVQAGPPGVDVFVDVKPGSCPNPLNTTSNGVLPVSVLGTMDLDVLDVDRATVRISRADGVGGMVAPLEGPPGPHTVVDDTGTPFFGDGCDCHALKGDGVDDLSMKFRTSELADVLELDDVPTGAMVELVVSGALLDGTMFSGSDCVRIISPVPGNVQVTSALPDMFLEVLPADVNGDGGGFPSFQRAFSPGEPVTVSAPFWFDGWCLVGWRLDGVFLGTSAPLAFPVQGATTVEPVYRRIGIRGWGTGF